MATNKEAFNENRFRDVPQPAAEALPISDFAIRAGQFDVATFLAEDAAGEQLLFRNNSLQTFARKAPPQHNDSAEHRGTVKKWICRDPDDYGIPHSERPAKLLRDCKFCSQHKQYGAYYNAAAHLRRVHFRVKPQKSAAAPTAGQIKAEEEKEKRGGEGKGGYGLPSMAELKLWMVEITVPMDPTGALVPDATESVGGGLDPEDVEDDHHSSQVGISWSMASGGFDMATFAGVGAAFSQAESPRDEAEVLVGGHGQAHEELPNGFASCLGPAAGSDRDESPE